MDNSAFFNITYGLFIVGVEFDGKKNACIINTAIQATSEPNSMIVTMQKTNLTTRLIIKKGSFTVSIISQDFSLEDIKSLGLRSGRDCNKLEGVEYKTDANGNPYFDKNTLSYMSLEVSSIIDLGTHYLIISKVTAAEKTGAGKPMTYADYRILKSGGTIESKEPESKTKTYYCPVCHYVYDGEIPFEELPDDYVCPVCGVPKSVFISE